VVDAGAAVGGLVDGGEAVREQSGSPMSALGGLGDVSSFVVAFGVDDPAASAGRDA
jgi:hypothetical protein